MRDKLKEIDAIQENVNRKLKIVGELLKEVEKDKKELSEKEKALGETIVERTFMHHSIPPIDLTISELKERLKSLADDKHRIHEKDLIDTTGGHIAKIPIIFSTDSNLFPQNFWKVPKEYYDAFWEREVYSFGYEGFYLLKANNGVLFIPYGFHSFLTIDFFENMTELQAFFKHVFKTYETNKNIRSLLEEVTN